MKKTILITGATDGIGLETAKRLYQQGHHILLHGRNADKLHAATKTLNELNNTGRIEEYLADLSIMSDVVKLANDVTQAHNSLDAIINNAGILRSPSQTTDDGYDIRFAVNTIAPYLLTKKLLPLLKGENENRARVINLSSAAQASIDIDALTGRKQITDAMEAYAQSKLAITIWSQALAVLLKTDGPDVFSVNPGSLLATKMVKEGFGVSGNNLSIGASILESAALSEDFSGKSGSYFDNDSGQFCLPHSDASNKKIVSELLITLDKIIKPHLAS